MTTTMQIIGPVVCLGAMALCMGIGAKIASRLGFRRSDSTDSSGTK